MSSTGPGSQHRHKDSRGLWTQMEAAHTHSVTFPAQTIYPADGLTQQQVNDLLALLVPTPPEPPPPPPPPPPTQYPVPDGLASGAITLQQAVNAATGPIGIPPRVYAPIITSKVGVDLEAIAPGVIVEGGTNGVRMTAGTLRLVGFEVRGANPGAQHGGVQVDGGTRIELIDCNLHHNAGAGFGAPGWPGGFYSLTRCKLNDNAQAGYSTGDCNGEIIDSEIARNNPSAANQGWEGGGGKSGRHTSMRIVNTRVVGNGGRGVWSDDHGNGWVVSMCTVLDNAADGIMFEAGVGAVINGNTCARNGAQAADWGYGAQILISRSAQAEILDNLAVVGIAKNANGQFSRGIVAITQNMAGSQPMHLVTIHDNDVIALAASPFLCAFLRDYADPSFDDGTSWARGNRYWHPSPEPTPANRFGRSRTSPYDHDVPTLAAFKALFADTTSRYLTAAEKDAALVAAGIS